MITATDFIYWAAALAWAFIPIHAQRMPVYWEREMQSYMPMYIPKEVFFPVWMITLVARAGYAALFFQNTVFDDFFSWIVVLWLSVTGLLLLWNWFFFTPVSFYAAGPIATLWFGCEVTILVLTIMYNDLRPWVIGFICIAVAWSLVAMILSWIVTVKLGPRYGVMRDAVARLTEQTIEVASGRTVESGSPIQEYAQREMKLFPVSQPLIPVGGLRLTQAYHNNK